VADYPHLDAAGLKVATSLRLPDAVRQAACEAAEQVCRDWYRGLAIPNGAGPPLRIRPGREHDVLLCNLGCIDAPHIHDDRLQPLPQDR
jgi:hypothetical protein